MECIYRVVGYMVGDVGRGQIMENFIYLDFVIQELGVIEEF